jgi:rod shape-determining protein MreD
MMYEEARGNRYIAISLIIAMALTILPLPETFANYRPEWVALVLLYWIMALPHRIGINIAWLMGISLDVLKGALLGQHALALVVLAFMMLNLSLRIRVYPFWQQSVMVGLILFFYHGLLLLIYDMTGTIEFSWQYWTPVLLGALLWPWVFIILRDLRRRHHVR